MRGAVHRAAAAAAAAAPTGGRAPPRRRPAGPSPRPPPSSRQSSTSVAPAPPPPRNLGEAPWSPSDDAAVARVLAEPAAGARPLLALGVADLKELVVAHGQPAYRGQQLYDALTRGASSWDDFTSVPKALRSALADAGVAVGRSARHATAVSADGTTKLLLRLADGHVIETVAIPALVRRAGARGPPGAAAAAPSPPPPLSAAHRKWTVCVSSQVGCPMRCAFCATGKGGYARQLAAHEIVDQVIAASSVAAAAGWAAGATGGAPPRPSNVVLMGMGEPLLNLKAVIPAVRTMIDRLGIGARKITISTVGVPRAIGRLAAEGWQVGLAVSLHAPTQALRESIVPSAKSYPLDALLADCVSFFEATGRRVTFEYALLKGVNDAPVHADRLARLLRSHDLRSHVNVIPFNAVEGAPFESPSRAEAAAFAAALERGGVAASVRTPRGTDAAAACGQLRNENQKVPLRAGAAAAAAA